MYACSTCNDTKLVQYRDGGPPRPCEDCMSNTDKVKAILATVGTTGRTYTQDEVDVIVHRAVRRTRDLYLTAGFGSPAHEHLCGNPITKTVCGCNERTK